jgi:hypothetical protein
MEYTFVLEERTMAKGNAPLITGDLLERYYDLSKQKKEIDLELNELKDQFHQYFNEVAGSEEKGEITINGYKLQRQMRKTEKYNDEVTIKRLEDLQMNDLIQVIKKPDDVKIKAALNLGLLNEEQLEGCLVTSLSPAITVKTLTPR